MKHQPGLITTDQLKVFSKKNNDFIVDVRPIDAYNGWKLQGEVRGGHIRGAKSLPAKWANYIDWIEIVRSKNILPENEIVLYGYENNESEKVAALFLRAGYQKIRYYQHFLDEWISDERLPMDRLPGYTSLVYAGWVNSLIHGEIPPEYHANLMGKLGI